MRRSPLRLLRQSFLRFFQIPGKIQAEVQTVDDLLISRFDVLQFLLEISSGNCSAIAVIQHIGYFRISRISFSRSGRYHVSSSLICADDVSDLLKLLCAREELPPNFTTFFIIISPCVLFGYLSKSRFSARHFNVRKLLRTRLEQNPVCVKNFLADSFIPQINFRFFLHFIGECLSKPVNRLA